MGRTDSSRGGHLDECHSKALVSERLEQVFRLFVDAESIHEKYGCGEASLAWVPSIERAARGSKKIAEAFDDFRIKTPKVWKTRPEALRKSQWVVRDRKKFLLLIAEVLVLIDSLQDITSKLSTAARLEYMLRARIDKIPNVDTLCMIAAVWKESHPSVASAASTQAECLSMHSGRRCDISDWKALVDSDVSEDYMAISELEDLTVTELKHS